MGLFFCPIFSWGLCFFIFRVHVFLTHTINPPEVKHLLSMGKSLQFYMCCKADNINLNSSYENQSKEVAYEL